MTTPLARETKPEKDPTKEPKKTHPVCGDQTLQAEEPLETEKGDPV